MRGSYDPNPDILLQNPGFSLLLVQEHFSHLFPSHATIQRSSTLHGLCYQIHFFLLCFALRAKSFCFQIPLLCLRHEIEFSKGGVLYTEYSLTFYENRPF